MRVLTAPSRLGSTRSTHEGAISASYRVRKLTSLDPGLREAETHLPEFYRWRKRGLAGMKDWSTVEFHQMAISGGRRRMVEEFALSRDIEERKLSHAWPKVAVGASNVSQVPLPASVRTLGPPRRTTANDALGHATTARSSIERRDA